jgi:hypothetical protein
MNPSEEAARRWNRLIPHYALTLDLLPGPNASWDELVYFAGTFDGYVVLPSKELLLGFAVESRGRFLRDGRLPEGLTMLRAALHAEQRYDYWHRDEEDDPGPDAMRHVHGLVEAVRGLVNSGAHTSPDRTTDAGVQDKVMNAYERLLVGYAAWGGYRYHGWPGYEDGAAYLGPAIWSERDCDLRLCYELEREWPGAVHQEFPIAKWTRDDFKPPEPKQRVDVAVADFTTFGEGPDASTRFKTHRQEAFFEVKWCLKGWTASSRELKARREAIPVDIAKLAHHVQLGRCAVAGMVVFDDDGWFHRQDLELSGGWPKGVWRLYLGPSALTHRQLIATGDEAAPASGEDQQ